MSKEKKFVDKNGEELIIRHRKSAIFFEREADQTKIKKAFRSDEIYYELSELEKKYYFGKDLEKEIMEYLKEIATEVWKDYIPKEADSFGSDYFEYYDREFDGNGYLSIGNENYWRIEGAAAQEPTTPIARLYKFNKPKFQSFIYDLEKKLG